MSSTKQLSQYDKEWKYIKLLGGNLTIGGYGCLITSFAWCMNYLFGWTLTPADVNRDLIKAGAARRDSLYTWHMLMKAYGVKEEIIDVRNRPFTGTMQKRLFAYLQNGGAVVMQVDMNPSTAKADMHFVVAYDMVGSRMKIMDPWGGVFINLRDRYFGKHISTFGRGIFRVIYLSKDGVKTQESEKETQTGQASTTQEVAHLRKELKHNMDGIKGKNEAIDSALPRLKQAVADLEVGRKK